MTDHTSTRLQKTVSGSEPHSFTISRKMSHGKKLKWSLGPIGPVSNTKDHVDDIYKEKDPIAASLLKRRKKGGLVTTVVQETKLHAAYFFTLKLKGPQPELVQPTWLHQKQSKPPQQAIVHVEMVQR